MKKVFFMVVCVATVLLCMSCGGSSSKVDGSFLGDGGGEQHEARAIIDMNIADLGESRWSKENYLEIRNNQIATFKGTQEDIDALQIKLDGVYGDVLVREGNLLMDDNCASNHGKLSQVMAELKNFSKAADADKLQARYKEHQDMLSFITSMGAKQPVNSYTNFYDELFETRMKNQAASYLKKDIKCSYIKTKLANPNFSARRNHFCNSIVNLYCQKSSFSIADERALLNKISRVNGRVEPEWQRKIQAFKDQHSN